MLTKFVDREPQKPNRFKVIPEVGDPYFVVLERADEAITQGTPLNATTLNNMLTRAAVVREQRGDVDVSFWIGSQEEYDALSEKPNNCLCIITDDLERADFVVEQGEIISGSDTWRYRKWNSGFAECWLRGSAKMAVLTECVNGGMYRTEYIRHALPVGMFTKVRYANVTPIVWDTVGLPHTQIVQASTECGHIQWFLYRLSSMDSSEFEYVVEMNGEWK